MELDQVRYSMSRGYDRINRLKNSIAEMENCRDNLRTKRDRALEEISNMMNQIVEKFIHLQQNMEASVIKTVSKSEEILDARNKHIHDGYTSLVHACIEAERFLRVGNDQRLCKRVLSNFEAANFQLDFAETIDTEVVDMEFENNMMAFLSTNTHVAKVFYFHGNYRPAHVEAFFADSPTCINIKSYQCAIQNHLDNIDGTCNATRRSPEKITAESPWHPLETIQEEPEDDTHNAQAKLERFARWQAKSAYCSPLAAYHYETAFQEPSKNGIQKSGFNTSCSLPQSNSMVPRKIPVLESCSYGRPNFPETPVSSKVHPASCCSFISNGAASRQTKHQRSLPTQILYETPGIPMGNEDVNFDYNGLDCSMTSEPNSPPPTGRVVLKNIENTSPMMQMFAKERQNRKHVESVAKINKERFMGMNKEPVVKIKTEPGVNIKTEPGVCIKTEPGANIKTEPGVNIKTEPGVNIKTEPGVNIKTEPDMNIKTEPGLNTARLPTQRAVTDKNLRIKSEPGLIHEATDYKGDTPENAHSFSRKNMAIKRVEKESDEVPTFEVPRSIKSHIKRLDLERQLEYIRGSGYEIHAKCIQTIEAGFDHPIGVCTNSSGYVIVADTSNNVIKVCINGDLVHTFGEDLKMWRPSAVLVNKRDEIFVKDDLCLYHFDPWGNFIKTIGKRRLGSPYGLGMTEQGELVVVDATCSNGRLHIIQQDGNSEAYPFQPLYPQYEDSKCRFLAVHGEQILTSDLGRSCLYLTDLRGKLISTLGRRGKRPGELHEPAGVATDSVGNWVVADSKNHRVQVFGRNCCFMADIQFSGDTVRRPSGIHLTNDGLLYVINYIEGVVKIFKIL